ncbi:Insulin-like domain-containing protein [Strongyloides ratti]|uniref:Insulin-like domain-containing protein n=1 Tax=Strongyloides ratti TaxID=34506 RepID=A0A090LKA9_STRRB|nr:Insulin-like domain-containing protein [Strongyloides ratti]CEF70202.1 Insulin-like domain-containing protein [Strongyloides ratti]
MINSQRPICGKRMKDKIFNYCSTYICPEINTSDFYENKEFQYVSYEIPNHHIGIALNCCTKGCNEKEIQDFCCGVSSTNYDIRKNDGELMGYEAIESNLKQFKNNDKQQ